MKGQALKSLAVLMGVCSSLNSFPQYYVVHVVKYASYVMLAKQCLSFY